MGKEPELFPSPSTDSLVNQPLKSNSSPCTGHKAMFFEKKHWMLDILRFSTVYLIWSTELNLAASSFPAVEDK